MSNQVTNTMTPEQMRAVFDQTLVGEADEDRIAKVQLLREYFCNPDFRAGLTQEVDRLINFDAPAGRA